MKKTLNILRPGHVAFVQRLCGFRFDDKLRSWCVYSVAMFSSVHNCFMNYFDVHVFMNSKNDVDL